MANTGPQGSSQHGQQGRREQGTGHPSQTGASKPADIVTSLTEKAQDVASGARETVQEWGSAAADAAGQAGHKAQELARSAAHRAENVGEDLTALIRRYPMQSCLLGLGVGFLLAQLGKR
jgi:ElaB/YqjD/DUF883 family membrane-anchored ribosome-binding protein